MVLWSSKRVGAGWWLSQLSKVVSQSTVPPTSFPLFLPTKRLAYLCKLSKCGDSS